MRARPLDGVLCSSWSPKILPEQCCRPAGTFLTEDDGLVLILRSAGHLLLMQPVQHPQSYPFHALVVLAAVKEVR